MLLMRTPYDKNAAQSGSGYDHPVLVGGSRLRGRRPGLPRAATAPRATSTRSATRRPDGYDTIEWAARLPGSDGRVAMYGFSYPGADAAPRRDERPAEPRCDRPGLHVRRRTRRVDLQRRRLRARVRGQLGGGPRARHGAQARGRPGMTRLEGAPAARTLVRGTSRWPTRPPSTRDEAPYYRRLARPPRLRRVLAGDGDRRGLLADRGSRPPCRRLVRRLPRGTIQNFVGDRSEGRGRGRSSWSGPGTHGPWEPPLGAGAASAAPHVVNDWQLRFLDEVVEGRPRRGSSTRP